MIYHIFAMAFDIKIEGLDEAIRKLEEMKRGLEPDVFAQWVNTIEKTAKEICQDPDCKRITFKPVGDLRIDIRLADSSAVNCVIQAIQKHMSSMPLTTRAFYQEVIKQLESRKNNTKKSD